MKRVKFGDDIVFDGGWAVYSFIGLVLAFNYLKPTEALYSLIAWALIAWMRGFMAIIRSNSVIGGAALIATFIFTPWVPLWASFFVPRSMTVTSWGADTVDKLVGNRLLVLSSILLFLAWACWYPTDIVWWALFLFFVVCGALVLMMALAGIAGELGYDAEIGGRGISVY